MTNRELLQKAMPLTSLTETEWNVLNDYLLKVSGNQISAILDKLITNQSRIEIMSNYADYYFDVLDKPLPRCSVELQAV